MLSRAAASSAHRPTRAPRAGASCDGGLRGQPGQRREPPTLAFLGDDHALHEEIPDAEVVFAQDEAGGVQVLGGLLARAEQRHLVGVKFLLATKHPTKETSERAQEQHAGAPAVRPKDDELSARPQDSMELTQDLSNFVPTKMLEHAEVVSAIERLGLERKIEDARLLDSVCEP